MVKKIIPGGAADKDGRLKVEDKIVGVGQGDEGEMVDVVDMKLNDVVKLIRGKRGTVVRLEVIPVGSTDRKVFKITREKIELKDSEAKGEVFEDGRKPDGTPYRIGVIDLPSFYMDMAGDRRGLADFKSTTRDVRSDPRRLQPARASTPWSSTCAATAAARSPRPSTSPGCSSTTGRWCRSRTPTAACSTSTTSIPAWPGRGRWWC